MSQTVNEENLHIWTAALRSGEFEQGKHTLGTLDPTGIRRNCCMGVGCEVMGIRGVPTTENIGSRVLVYGKVGFSGLPPSEFHEWLGKEERSDLGRHSGWDVYPDWPAFLRDRNGTCLTSYSCSGLNDAVRLTFPQIADVLDYFGIL